MLVSKLDLPRVSRILGSQNQKFQVIAGSRASLARRGAEQRERLRT